jgi:hypothetical protein
MNEEGAIFKLLSCFLDVMSKALGSFWNGIVAKVFEMKLHGVCYILLSIW